MSDGENNPALDFLLSGIDDQKQKESVTQSYFTLSGGSSNSIPVQFALLMKASALCQLRVTEELRKVAESTGDAAIIDRIEKLEVRVGDIPGEVSKALPTTRALKDVAEALKVQISNMPRNGILSDKRAGERESSKGLLAFVCFLSVLNILVTGALSYLIFSNFYQGN